MTKVAIAYSTKDRVELSQRSIEPLVQPDKFDLYWVDGSTTERGLAFFAEEHENRTYQSRANVRGGADPAIAYGLTLLLNAPEKYDMVGLVENDVLCRPDWFEPTLSLFEQGRQDGLPVGAVSARCYEDRILIQRDGYAVCHNVGAGMQLYTREAAQLILKYMRTGYTADNRVLFARLSGLDIAPWWAFGVGEHAITADWNFDRVLAAHGLASLALTPSPVEMIGQVPPLAEQGLTLATGPVEARRNAEAFGYYGAMLNAIRDGEFDPQVPLMRQRGQDGSEITFAHHLGSIHGAEFQGDWTLKWSAGFGPFGWVSTAGASFECYVSGAMRFLVTGGDRGGQVAVEDLHSGYTMRPVLQPDMTNQVLQIVVPSGVSYRKVRLTCLAPGIVFYGIQCQEAQPTVPFSFDHSVLPPVA